jgi:hypothetical protein
MKKEDFINSFFAFLLDKRKLILSIVFLGTMSALTRVLAVVLRVLTGKMVLNAMELTLANGFIVCLVIVLMLIYINIDCSDNIETKKQPQLLHFTRIFTELEQKKLFYGLTKGGYLPKETAYSHFCHVLGGEVIPDNESPFNPLKWEKSQSLLAYFVFNLFSETDGNFWNITAECFTVRGKRPNIGVMTTEQSKVKNKEKDPPKGHEKIDDIIMSLA